LNFTADPGATSEVRAIAFSPPEACCEELSDALPLLDAESDALPVDALLEAALLEALPDALPLLPEPPPQAERTDAPATLTPMAPPSRINCPREIFSFKILPSLPVMKLFVTKLYTQRDRLRLCHPAAPVLRIRTIV